MNLLLEQILSNKKGTYCHCVEVQTVYELESIAEAIYNEHSQEYNKDVIIDFLESLSVYYLGLNQEEEEEVYNFSFSDYINELI